MTSRDERTPAELDCTNLVKEWPIWKGSFLMYLMATEKDKIGEPNKIATFLWLIGPKAMQIYHTLFPNDGTTDGILGKVKKKTNNEQESGRKLDDVLKAFDEYCIPRKNTTMETFKFNTLIQKENQIFAEYETQLRKQAQYCEFKCTCGISYEERMLKDRIIIGINDKKLRVKLLDKKNIALQDVIDQCKSNEMSSENERLLTVAAAQASVISVDSLQVDEQPKEIDSVSKKCYNCGEDYKPTHLRYCKANNATCVGCGKRGHFMRFCRSSKGQRSDNKTVNQPGNNNKNYINKKQNHQIVSYDWGATPLVKVKILA